MTFDDLPLTFDGRPWQVDWERWIEHKQPLRPGGRQHDDPLWAHPALVTCAPWSGELEALRSLLALSLVLQVWAIASDRSRLLWIAADRRMIATDC